MAISNKSINPIGHADAHANASCPLIDRITLHKHVVFQVPTDLLCVCVFGK